MSFLHSHCNHKDHHHEHGCMRVDAGLARHQSLSRNLVNPCPSRYIPLHYNPLHYIALHLPCATITCTNLRYISPATITCTTLRYISPATITCTTLRYISPVLQYATLPCTTFSCATKHTASLQLRKLGYTIAGSRHNTPSAPKIEWGGGDEYCPRDHIFFLQVLPEQCILHLAFCILHCFCFSIHSHRGKLTSACCCVCICPPDPTYIEWGELLFYSSTEIERH